MPFGDLTVSAVQPYQARKAYACPGCDSTIEAGVGHVVVIPELAPDLRRHWHRGCWFKEMRRRGRPARPDDVTPHPSSSRP